MNFTEASVNRIITHKVGNKLKNEPLFLSDALQRTDAELDETLIEFFLKPFLRKSGFMGFTHASDINLNEMYHYVSKLFSDPEEGDFIETTKHIAKHLFNASVHPKIVPGELLIVHFKNVRRNELQTDAVGIFKSEHKEPFLKVTENDLGIRFSKETGINVSKIEKGCLIFDDPDREYDVVVVDRDQNTQYWVNKFLGVEPKKTDEYNTKQVVNLCKTFGDDVLSLKYEPETKLEFLNSAIDHLEKNDVFDYDAFIHDNMVFREPNLRQDFLEYQQKTEFNPTDLPRFDIAHRDLKRERRQIKSLVRLDTGIEIRFFGNEHGSVSYEKGYDEAKGMHFYKVYYNKEVE